jgi:ribosome-binding factor A
MYFCRIIFRQTPKTFKEKIKNMEGTRLVKIERLLQKELSELFRRQTALMHGTLVSVSAVRVSPDLSLAKAYLSIFPSERGAEILASIEKNKKTLRYDLGQIVRTQLRRIPELAFLIDDSLDYVANIDKLLQKANT